MENKEIIIDGVDVSGCTRYCTDNGKCTAFKSQYLCSERNNCYTKRILKKNKTINILKEKLLRKEQECEELKIYIESNEQQVKEVETLVMDNDRLINELDQLKAENEELKEILNEGCLHNLTLMTEQRVLLQTLTEIKELLLKTPTDSPMHCINAKSVILQKISECEGNDG